MSIEECHFFFSFTQFYTICYSSAATTCYHRPEVTVFAWDGGGQGSIESLERVVFVIDCNGVLHPDSSSMSNDAFNYDKPILSPRFSACPAQTIDYKTYLHNVSLGGIRQRQKPQAPVRNRQTRKVANAKVRTGYVRSSQVRLSQVRLSQVRLSQVWLSQVWLSQVRLSEVKLGQARLVLRLRPLAFATFLVWRWRLRLWRL